MACMLPEVEGRLAIGSPDSSLNYDAHALVASPSKCSSDRPGTASGPAHPQIQTHASLSEPLHQDFVCHLPSAQASSRLSALHSTRTTCSAHSSWQSLAESWTGASSDMATLLQDPAEAPMAVAFDNGQGEQPLPIGGLGFWLSGRCADRVAQHYWLLCSRLG